MGNPKRAEGFLLPTPEERLKALQARLRKFEAGELEKPVPTDFVNNHIHTIYSFSPYSPAGAAFTAWWNGLSTAGIMDHDSVAGAREFLQAGQALGLAATVGFECRCSMQDTPFAGRRLNNPDQRSVAYVACHGVPHQQIDAAQQWLAPVRRQRGLRNRKMVDNINALLAGSGVALAYDRDVLPLSQAAEGGGVTERHILYALAFRMTAAVGKGPALLDFLNTRLQLCPTGKNLAALRDPHSPDYEYTLLGALKAGMVEKFYVDATDECPDIREFVRFCRSIGAIPAYAYLGDVEESPTGDKKAQAFEDDYLDELVPWLVETGFEALTYMPTRNTPRQLARLMALCETAGLFQISGEDINSPSQSFICEALEKPEYRHLVESTWALIGHEKAATRNPEDGMFSEASIRRWPALPERIAHFAALGKR